MEKTLPRRGKGTSKADYSEKKMRKTQSEEGNLKIQVLRAMYEATSRIEELRRKFSSLEIYKLYISKEENLLVEDANINGCVEDPLKWFEILVP